MINDDLKFWAFQYLSALSATFELKARILVDLILPKHKSNLNLESVEDIIFTHFYYDLSFENCIVLQGARVTRNNLLHCDFVSLFSDLERYFGFVMIDNSIRTDIYDATSSAELIDIMFSMQKGMGIKSSNDNSVFIGAINLNDHNIVVQISEILKFSIAIIDKLIIKVSAQPKDHTDTSYYYLLKKKFTYYSNVQGLSVKDSWRAAYKDLS